MQKLISLIILLTLGFVGCKQSTEPTQPKQNPPGYQEDVPWPSLADSPWPTHRGNMLNNGLTFKTGDILLKKTTKIKTTEITSSLVIKDTLIYFTGSRVNYGLYCYSISGTYIWRFELDDFMNDASFTTPVITNEGVIYFLTVSTLYAINPDGSLKWKTVINDYSSQISPANITLDKSGNIFLVDYGNTLYKINRNGNKVAEINSESFQVGNRSALSFSPNGKTLYIPGYNNIGFSAVDIDNMSIKWKFTKETESFSGISPIVNSQGQIFVAFNSSDSSTFYCIDENGNELWRYELEGSLTATPTIDVYGNLYVPAKRIYSFSYDGKLRFVKEIITDTGLISDKNSNIYIFPRNQNLEVIKMDYNGNLTNSFSNNFFGQYENEPTLADGKILIPMTHTADINDIGIYIIE